jgi:hypothetical protein
MVLISHLGNLGFVPWVWVLASALPVSDRFYLTGISIRIDILGD